MSSITFWFCCKNVMSQKTLTTTTCMKSSVLAAVKLHDFCQFWPSFSLDLVLKITFCFLKFGFIISNNFLLFFSNQTKQMPEITRFQSRTSGVRTSQLGCLDEKKLLFTTTHFKLVVFHWKCINKCCA